MKNITEKIKNIFIEGTITKELLNLFCQYKRLTDNYDGKSDRIAAEVDVKSQTIGKKYNIPLVDGDKVNIGEGNGIIENRNLGLDERVDKTGEIVIIRQRRNKNSITNKNNK